MSANDLTCELPILLQRDLPTTICAGSRLFAIMSATLGIEGGFKANVLLELAATF